MAYNIEKSAEIAISAPEETKTVGHLVNQEDHETSKLQSIKGNPKAFLWCIYAIWVLVINSFELQAGGVVLGIPQFRKDFGTPFKGDYVLPAQWQSAFSGGPVAMTIIGSLLSGYIADKIGRKFVLLVGFLLSFVGISLQVAATTNELFFAGKMFTGVAAGSFISVSMTYVGEVAPMALRGVMTAACALAFIIGPLICAIVVNYTGNVQTRWAYRAAFVAQYGFSGVGIILLPFMPELHLIVADDRLKSPWWLLSIGKEADALRSLKRLLSTEQEAEKRMANIKTTLEEARKETEGVTFLECFRKSNLRRTIISIAPLAIQALSGISFVFAYSTYYFQLAGFSTSESFNLQIALQALSLTGNIVSWPIIDRVGRRSLTFYGLLFLTVLLIMTGALGTVGTPGAVKGTAALILTYCFFYNVTIGATAYTLLTEVSTARLRVKTVSIGLALQFTIYTMWAFVMPYLFNPDKANLGAKVTFICAGLAILSLIFIWFYLPETANRTYEELDELFIKKTPCRRFRTTTTETEKKGREVATELR